MEGSSRRPSFHDGGTSFQSTTFDRDVEIRVNETVGSASVSPSGRDVVLASADGLHIIDLDSPYSAPRYLSHRQPFAPADVQWSPFASRDYWIISTSGQKALVWNVELTNSASPIQHTLHAHNRNISDINFSAHHPDILATCAIDTFIHCWDLRAATKPFTSYADFRAGAKQVKWNRQDEHILASAHDKFLKIWDDRKGTEPLKTIEAHSTQVTGIDWNRTRRTGILTCSLDNSIKFWDYAKGDKPERVIGTQFPVRTARHTPFGWGVLALPQRSDNDVHLYDRRLSEKSVRVGFIEPVHSFAAHTSTVKEFLWRARGTIEQGIDNRDFQLISWGEDRVLHLHRVDSQILKQVGHEKGKDVRKNMPMTRKGAVYKSFNPPQALTFESSPVSPGPAQSLLGKQISAAGMSKMPLPLAPLGREQASMTYSGKFRKRDPDPIKWMSGVTVRNRSETTSKGYLGFDNPESLKDEMTTVSGRYTKVNFEEADVHGRKARVTLNGPWGPEEKPVFMRVSFEFPGDYPTISPAICTLEKTAGGVSDEVHDRLSEEVQKIVDIYQIRRLGCLEAVITYLLGERGLEESITLPDLNDPYSLVSPRADESSSDDDDEVDATGQDLETSAEGALGLRSAQANVNVPLPRTCGARWSITGRLVCFFPPKPEPKPAFNLDTLRSTTSGEKTKRDHRHGEGFGRLLEESPASKRRGEESVDDIEDAEGSADSWTSSSSSSSEDSFDDASRLPSRYHPPAAWRAATLKTQKTSSHSGSGGPSTYKRSAMVPKPKSIAIIQDLFGWMPASKELAEGYMIFGDGPEVCEHNAKVARANGFSDYATTWELCRRILHNEVPLEVLDQVMRKEPILVVAKRNMVRVRRKDSGLDLAFDDPPKLQKPVLTGRVKWGAHPFAGKWLIPKLIEHFEREADVQMLAMLSCVFSEPAARDGMQNATAGLKENALPIAMQAPGFSVDYFASADVAWSQFKDPSSVNVVSATPKEPRGATPRDYFDRRITTYGSAGSSNGPWEGDFAPSGPQTPYSTGETPPAHTPFSSRSHRNSTVNSLSTSPEQTMLKAIRRPASNLTANFSLSKAFTSLSTSPTTQDRFKAAEADLSTSAPTAPTSGVTWGSTTFISSNESHFPEKGNRRTSSRRSSFKLPEGVNTTESDDDYSNSSDEEPAISYNKAPSPKSRGSEPAGRKVKVVLKNQHLFDDSAHAAIPLLDPKNAEKYEGWRRVYAELLGAWDLYIQQAEILKMNGLINYWNDAQGDKHIGCTCHPQNKSGEVAQAATSPEVTQGNVSAFPDLAVGVGGAGKELGAETPRKPVIRHCHICLERIRGLYISCGTEEHHAHTACYEAYASGNKAEEMLVKGVGCFCALSADMEASWGSLMGGAAHSTT